ncbi:MAG: hypothetical protein JST28_15830 [Acidobacteria bacterium]|nr:hypothetical protein [Acidobacteriota bacterium]
MTHRFARIRRFHFNLPQRIAAVLLALFLLQGLWVVGHQTLSEADYRYARCGRETWEKPSPLAGYYTSCGNIRDGLLAYRLAGLPLTFNVLAQRGIDLFRKPEDRVFQTSTGQGSVGLSMWELRHQITHVLLLLRLPFLAAGCVLGGGLWWVTRRLYGNMGGYVALALYCFSPPVLKACLSPSPEILAALGIYGGIYTCIGVAHAMQGPRRKWRPRIILLTIVLGIAAAAHIVALPIAALLGFALMLWIAEGRRSQILPIVLLSSAGALVLLFVCYGFSPDAFSYVFRSGAAFLSASLEPSQRLFTSPAIAGIIVATGAATLLYLGVNRLRYFGNTAPLICFIVIALVVTKGVPASPSLWALPFLLTFIGGVFADAFESERRKLFITAAASLVILQIAICIMSLPRLI